MVARDAGRQTSSVRAWYASRPYRLTAVGLFLLGSAAGALAIVGPSDGPRDVLTAFAGVGLFGALLLFFLRPSATSATDPVEEVYRAYAANADALARNVDLGERRVYAPTTYATEGFTAVALTVPTEERERVSIDRNRRPVFGTADHDDWSAITLYPTGAALFDAFEGMVVADLSTDPVELATQLADGLVLGLELVEAVEPDVDIETGTATIDVVDPRFGSLEQFDHPVASFLAVGFALSLDVPVTVETESDRVVCRWPSDEVGDD
ncbi:hypothetical protein [Halapricum salinum]|uniref:DUF7982 domain-containing protein n=1 Tax=Halapricum salinum TaxID=1457250 RepID=A0A4D6HB36_9EURY|nr:hypothetical protein [Halapricum salinum]QCC50368.1 hypothetical protein DV733_03560 [Halapricum salinum]